MSDVRETVVLIHGYGFDHRVWSPVEIAFEGFNVVHLTLPGFGDDVAPSAYSISALAAHYLEGLEHKTKTAFHLVGHSMGGYVSMEMVAQKPERIASLVLLHSHVFEDSPEKKQQRSKTLEEIRGMGQRPLVYRMIPSLFTAGRVPGLLIDALIERGMTYPADAWYYGALAMRDRLDHALTLSKIKVPVMIVAGQHDAAVPVELAYRMAALPERCLLRVYTDTAHMAMYENMLALVEDLRAFIRHEAV